MFKFHEMKPIISQEVILEPWSVITGTPLTSSLSTANFLVWDGQVGIAYNRGVLKVLNPGEHVLNAEENQVGGSFNKEGVP